MNEKVSIIIPCYNHGKYLPEALESVLLQNYSNWECIIVNDGSTDNTESVAAEWCKRDARLRYLKIENGGLANARNKGIQATDGDYILPLDADDKISKSYVEDALPAFETDPDLKLVYGRAEYFGELAGEWELEDFNWDKFIFYNQIYPAAIYKRDDFNRSPGYNPQMKYGWEDWDFWISLLKDKPAVYKIPKICFYYRVRAQSMVRVMTKKQRQYLRRIVYYNHSEIYSHLFPDPLTLYGDYNYGQEKIKSMESSIPFQINRYLSFPFRWIKRKFL